ncbi:KAP-like P-loop domain-containing protein [Paraburkholderia sp. BL6669N2]|uniref:P-loop NTPase fold protein n=1 Tax=Paraburkholderia sp. BL6669N2 TaxID=1938807 RepID=UPI000E234A9B|nr:P-loop NTPase fold protein [Paraburkholderia sp. BL6669N2]REG59300.1 KAP-like P-loop domain-containing protein [Paraburkholderia sp. BL6669N2]
MDPKTPTLIVDEPAGKDALGPHQRVADAIYRIVTTQSGGKTIRLDGEWGAGKSTVVRLLKERRENDRLVFVYDAWVHVGDPLRRVFLDSLVESLTQATWLSSDWKRERDILAGKIKVTVERKAPKIDGLTRATFGAVLFLPLLTALVFQIWPRIGTSLGQLELIPGIVLCVSVALLCAFLIRSLSDKWIGFLLSRTPLEYTTEKQDEPSATSIEFQKFFAGLMEDGLNRKPDSSRKLVIVIDNLDRVVDAEVKEIWALLRSFLDNPQFKQAVWFKNLWVLIPIAKPVSDVSNSASTRTVEPAKPKGEDVGQSAADSTKTLQRPLVQRDIFLEKVFQLQLELQPPTLAAWTSYLREQLSEAIGTCTAPVELDDCVRLYLLKTRDRVPTPRELVRFVNDVSGLIFQWGEAYPVRTLVAFALTGPRERLIQQIEDGSRPWEAFVTGAEDAREFERAFKSLVFGIAEKWKLTLSTDYRAELISSLKVGNSTKILEAIRCNEGWIVDSLISELPLLASSPPHLFAALRAFSGALASLKSESGDSGLLPGSFKTRLGHICRRSLSELENLCFETEPGVVAAGFDAFFQLMKVCPGEAGPSAARLIADAMNRWGPNDARDTRQKDLFTRNLLEILSVGEIAEGIRGLKGYINLPLDGQSWVSACIALMSRPVALEDDWDLTVSMLNRCLPVDGPQATLSAVQRLFVDCDDSAVVSLALLDVVPDDLLDELFGTLQVICTYWSDGAARACDGGICSKSHRLHQSYALLRFLIGRLTIENVLSSARVSLRFNEVCRELMLLAACSADLPDSERKRALLLYIGFTISSFNGGPLVTQTFLRRLMDAPGEYPVLVESYSELLRDLSPAPFISLCLFPWPNYEGPAPQQFFGSVLEHFAGNRELIFHAIFDVVSRREPHSYPGAAEAFAGAVFATREEREAFLSQYLAAHPRSQTR